MELNLNKICTIQLSSIKAQNVVLLFMFCYKPSLNYYGKDRWVVLLRCLHLVTFTDGYITHMVDIRRNAVWIHERRKQQHMPLQMQEKMSDTNYNAHWDFVRVEKTFDIHSAKRSNVLVSK